MTFTANCNDPDDTIKYHSITDDRANMLVSNCKYLHMPLENPAGDNNVLKKDARYYAQHLNIHSLPKGLKYDQLKQ